MNILILGCSFGVPYYEVGTHTEELLTSLGYTVYNCSQNSSSNINSLNRAYKFLKGEKIIHPRVPYMHNEHAEENKNLPLTIEINIVNPKIDWIIWFHTELIRDSFYDNLDAETVYSAYATLKNNLNAKLCIIGGAGPVLPSIYRICAPDFCIPSWFNEILNLTLPDVQTLSRPDLVRKLNGIGLERKLEILDEHLHIKRLLEESLDFPDNYHPGPGPHKILTQRLHALFNSQ